MEFFKDCMKLQFWDAGDGASASKSGEFGYALLLYQCYSHLVEWLVVAE
jgi:hypothetical protein